MNPNPQKARLAALLGFLAVALGAFGAHGLQETLKANGAVEIWKTASHYQMIHAVMLLVLGLFSSSEVLARFAWWSFLFGVLIFSGSLYVLSVTGLKWLGAITPIGGLLLMAGWLLTAVLRWPRS